MKFLASALAAALWGAFCILHDAPNVFLYGSANALAYGVLELWDLARKEGRYEIFSCAPGPQSALAVLEVQRFAPEFTRRGASKS